MTTTHIRVSEEAKKRLEARKHEDESFTDVVIRLTEPDGTPDSFVGKYDEVDLAVGVEGVRHRMDREFETVRR